MQNFNHKNNQPIHLHNSIENFAIPQKKLAGDQPKITKIQAQKRPGRYNIFIDNQFAFGVSEEVLIQFQLQKGMEVPQSLQAKIQAQEKVEKAFRQALNYLSYGLRTEREIEDYLLKKEFNSEIPAAIQKLKDQHLVDDLEYSKSFIRTGARISKKGPKRLRMDLIKKGVSEVDIEKALPEYSKTWQLENAIELAEKYFNKQKNNSGKEAIMKTQNHLLTKGYEFATIKEAIDANHFEMDDEVELKALRKLGEKAWNRYSRNEEDRYQVIQKTKAYLYRKGFNGEQIEQFISEMEDF